MSAAGRHIDVLDSGRTIRITTEAMQLYHGFVYPGGIAHALKVMQRVFPLLATDGLVERREVHIRTCFTGEGARDAFELVTRARTDGRYVLVPALARPHRGPTNQGYVFELTYRGRTVTAIVREGHVRDAFITLGSREDRSPEQEAELIWMRQEMADRLLALPAEQVYDVELGPFEGSG